MQAIQDLWPIAVIVFLTTLIIEWLTRSKKFPYWIGRKVLHIIAISVCAAAPLITQDINGLFWFIFPVWLLLLGLIYSNRLMTDENGRPAWGISWFPLAYLILLHFFQEQPKLIALSMGILAICDPMATIFGKLFGRRSYSLSGEPKTLIGNVAFFISLATSLVIIGPQFGFHSLAFLLFATFVLTATEAMGSYGSDNILLPLVAALLFKTTTEMSFSSPAFIVLLLSFPAAWLLVKSQKLTIGGAVGAALLALLVTFQTDSYLPLLPLLFFLGSSVLLEKILPSTVASDAKDRQARDLMQVVANGGIYGLVFLLMPDLVKQIIGISQTNEIVSALYASQQDEVILSRFLLGMGLIALSVATADTWASAVGKYFKKQAFDPFRWQSVPAGLSGGMSWAGSIAGLIGSVSIASFLFLLLPDWKILLPHFIMISLAGFGGMLLDSLLGSRLQRQYFYQQNWHDTPAVNGQVEKTRGLSWMSNDMVNLLSTLVICVALYITFLLR